MDPEPPGPDAEEDDAPDERALEKSERTRVRKAVQKLGWKWVNRTTVEVPYERELHVGPRTVR